MIPSILLNNGLEMPQFGIGMYLVPEDQANETLFNAYEYGYRLIDTAAIYGNEAAIGKAIRHMPRKELFITTKLWNSDHGYENTLKAFQNSLNLLHLDYIDLYLMHWPCPKKGLYIETWKAFEELYKKGLIKAIGVSNFNPEHLDHLLKEAEITPAVNQIELHPLFTQEISRNYAKKHNIQIESWYPLGGRRHTKELLELPLFKELSSKYNKSGAQIILRWHIDLGLIVIPKSLNPEHIKENRDIFDFKLNEEEIQSISLLNQNKRFGLDPDTFMD